MKKITPSILFADFANLKRVIHALEGDNADCHIEADGGTDTLVSGSAYFRPLTGQSL